MKHSPFKSNNQWNLPEEKCRMFRSNFWLHQKHPYLFQQITFGDFYLSIRIFQHVRHFFLLRYYKKNNLVCFHIYNNIQDQMKAKCVVLFFKSSMFLSRLAQWHTIAVWTIKCCFALHHSNNNNSLLSFFNINEKVTDQIKSYRPIHWYLCLFLWSKYVRVDSFSLVLQWIVMEIYWKGNVNL